MINYYRHVTKYGTWMIVPENYLWEIYWNDHSIGHADTAIEAVEKLTGNDVNWPSDQFTVNDCAFPTSIKDWEIVRHR